MHQLTNRPCEHFPVNTNQVAKGFVCLKQQGVTWVCSAVDMIVLLPTEFFYGQKHPGKKEKSMSFQYIAISKIVGCPFDLKKRNKSFCWQKQQLGQLDKEFMR